MKLFEKSTIKGLELKNRFFRASTWEALATEEGRMTPELFALHKELAEGGVGSILTGYAFVTKEEQPNPKMLGIYDDTFIDMYKELTDMCKSYDTKIFLQVAYGGSMSYLSPPSPKILAPSAKVNEATGILPTAMTEDDILYLKNAFVQACCRAEKAGFHGVQIHSAHGYLLSQFLSPDYNLREDAYGGCLENRVRLLREIIEDVRKAVREDFVILTKINSEDFTEKGLTQEDSLQAVKILEKAGLDGVEVSGGNLSSKHVLQENLGCGRKKITSQTQSYFSSFAKKLVQQVRIPVILTGGNINCQHLEELHTQHGIAYFGLSRPLIAEPALIQTWEKNPEAKPLCISCAKCFSKKGAYCILHVRAGKS